MEQAEIRAKVISKIKEQMGEDIGEITGKEGLMKDLNLASLEIMTILADMEQEFGITLDEDQVMEIQTVNDLVECICSLA